LTSENNKAKKSDILLTNSSALNWLSRSTINVFKFGYEQFYMLAKGSLVRLFFFMKTFAFTVIFDGTMSSSL